MKDRLPTIGFIVIMLGFAYISVRMIFGGSQLNLATWTMWVIIDTLLLLSMIIAGNKRPWAMAGLELGACTVAGITATKVVLGEAGWRWGTTETLVATCVVVSLCVWPLVGDKLRVIAITTAMYVAMIPTFVDLWRIPDGQEPLFWGACATGCALEFFGKPKTIEHAFFPACGAIFNGLAAVMAARHLL